MAKLKGGYICILSGSRLFETAYGEERFTLSLGFWLQKNGNNVVLAGRGLVNAKTAYVSELSDTDFITKIPENVKISRQPYFIFFASKIYLTLSWILKLIIINSRTKISIIHATDTGFAGLAALLVGRILGIPVVVTSLTIRYNLISSSIRGKFNKMLLKLDSYVDKFTSSHADTLIAVNKDMSRQFEQLSRRPVTVIPPPIRTRNFRFSDNERRSIRKELRIDKDAIVIGFIGRLSVEKNVITLAKVFGEIAREYDGIILLIVGTGPLESDITQYLTDHGVINKIRMCGTRYDIPSILSSLDIFVQPSYIEGMSLSLLEAMAAGRAIICSNIPANAELVTHHVEGLIIDPSNHEDMKNALVILLNDKGLRDKYGLNAVRKAEFYDEAVVFPKINEIYEKILK